MAVNIRTARRQSIHQRSKPMSEINVTPFVDVMLVLLVIFMVTAPLLTVGVQVDLPETKASTIKGNDEPLAVSISIDGKVYIQDTETSVDSIVAKLRAISDNNSDLRIFVRGDAQVNYGRVMEVMGVINAAGFRKVALIARQPGASDPNARRKKEKKDN